MVVYVKQFGSPENIVPYCKAVQDQCPRKDSQWGQAEETSGQTLSVCKQQRLDGIQGLKEVFKG